MRRSFRKPSRRLSAPRRRPPLEPRTGFGRRPQPIKAKPAPHIAAGFTLAAKAEDRCRNCGAPATELHHAVPRSRSRLGRDDLRNGLPVCHGCHVAWHAGQPFSREIFTAAEWAFIEEIAPGPGWLGRRYPSLAWRIEEAA